MAQTATVRRALQILNGNELVSAFVCWRQMCARIRRQYRLMESALRKWMHQPMLRAFNKWRATSSEAETVLDERIDVLIRYEGEVCSCNVSRGSSIRMSVMEHSQIPGLCHTMLQVGSEPVSNCETWATAGLESGACISAQMKPMSRKEESSIRFAMHLLNGEPHIVALSQWQQMVRKSQRGCCLMKSSVLKWRATAGLDVDHPQMYDALMMFRSAVGT